MRKRNINPDNFHYEDTPEEGPKRKRRKKHDTSEEKSQGNEKTLKMKITMKKMIMNLLKIMESWMDKL